MDDEARFDATTRGRAPRRSSLLEEPDDGLTPDASWLADDEPGPASADAGARPPAQPTGAEPDGADARDAASEADRSARLQQLGARSDDLLARLQSAANEIDEPAPDDDRGDAPPQRRVIGSYRGTPVYADEPTSTERSASIARSPATDPDDEPGTPRIIGHYRGSPIYADDGSAGTGGRSGSETGSDERSGGRRRWRRPKS